MTELENVAETQPHEETTEAAHATTPTITTTKAMITGTRMSRRRR